MQTLGSVLDICSLFLGESWNAPTPFEFTVTIRTTSSSGLLLSVGDKNRHVVVYINDTLVSTSGSVFICLSVCLLSVCLRCTFLMLTVQHSVLLRQTVQYIA